MHTLKLIYFLENCFKGHSHRTRRHAVLMLLPPPSLSHPLALSLSPSSGPLWVVSRKREGEVDLWRVLGRFWLCCECMQCHQLYVLSHLVLD